MAALWPQLHAKDRRATFNSATGVKDRFGAGLNNTRFSVGEGQEATQLLPDRASRSRTPKGRIPATDLPQN